ncbi:MAG TPA: DUF1697 domain-containing protein [Candidatus Eisenbacteria bacterium]
MTRYVAFLRSINVGGHTVTMAALRHHFESLGLAGVETFIASGNVLFDASTKSPGALEVKIERALRATLGYEVATFLRSLDEVAAIARHEPFPRMPPGAGLYVAFTAAAPKAAARAAILSRRSDIDDFHVRGREIYWLCRGRSSDSEFSGAFLEKLLGGPATIRNVNTVRRLAAKYPGRD